MQEIHYVEYKRVTYFELENGMLLSDNLRDVFEWFVFRRASKVLIDAMGQTAPGWSRTVQEKKAYLLW